MQNSIESFANLSESIGPEKCTEVLEHAMRCSHKTRLSSMAKNKRRIAQYDKEVLLRLLRDAMSDGERNCTLVIFCNALILSVGIDDTTRTWIIQHISQAIQDWGNPVRFPSVFCRLPSSFWRSP